MTRTKLDNLPFTISDKCRIQSTKLSHPGNSEFYSFFYLFSVLNTVIST